LLSNFKRSLKMNSIASIALRQAILKPFTPQLTQVANARIYASHSDGLFRMGKLKKRYMQKAPIVVTKDDGSVQVEGVSNKQYPEVAPWRQPDYMYRGNPGEDGSGDLEIYPEPELKRPMLEYVGLKAYDNATPEVKRVLSLEMGRRSDIRKIVNEEYRMMVAEHKHDHTSNVVSIALLTLKIRNLQKHLGQLGQRGWRAAGKKHALVRAVNARRAQLGHLRTQDYPKYEWLLEKLNIVYKPRPYTFENIVRRRHTQRLVNLLCDETRTFKLQSLKDALEEDQPIFLRKKKETLENIMKKEKDFGLPETVTQKEIDEVRVKLEEVENKLTQRKKRVINYHIFKEQKVEDEHKVLS